jgi:hypothetical protein
VPAACRAGIHRTQEAGCGGGGCRDRDSRRHCARRVWDRALFDVQQIVEGLTKIGLGIVFAGVTAARAVSACSSPMVCAEVAHLRVLRDCVESLITELVPRELRARTRMAVDLDVGTVRLTWPVTLTIFYLESEAADPTVNPRALHPTFINLYDLIGGFTARWPPGFRRPRNELVIAGTKQRPTRDDIDRYLAATPLPETGSSTRGTSRNSASTRCRAMSSTPTSRSR